MKDRVLYMGVYSTLLNFGERNGIINAMTFEKGEKLSEWERKRFWED